MVPRLKVWPFLTSGALSNSANLTWGCLDLTEPVTVTIMNSEDPK